MREIEKERKKGGGKGKAWGKNEEDKSPNMGLSRRLWVHQVT